MTQDAFSTAHSSPKCPLWKGACHCLVTPKEKHNQDQGWALWRGRVQHHPKESSPGIVAICQAMGRLAPVASGYQRLEAGADDLPVGAGSKYLNSG